MFASVYKHSSLLSRSVIDADDIVSRFEQRHDIQRNDTQHNDAQHNNIQHNSKLNMTFRIISECCCMSQVMLSATNKPLMLNVVTLSVNMLSVTHKPFNLSLVMLSVTKKPFSQCNYAKCHN
jgi:hypothetical protein